MKQSLHLRQGLQLTMTPQLQQAIKLLQMSTLDLQQEIQQALESNMMLEISDDDNNNTGAASELPTEKKTEQSDTQTSEGSQTDIPDELPVDSSWEDIYDTVMESGSHNNEQVEFETQRSNSATLLDHLLWQMELTRFSERDHAIAIAIIDSINEDGYLTSNPEEIFQGLQSQLDDLDVEEVTAVLHRIQNFDPAGVAALDLSDCLRLQLLQLPESTPYRAEALVIVSQYLDLLATHEQTKLMRKLGLTERQLDLVVALIRTLEPKPGSRIQEHDSEYVIPDVYVVKQNGVWQVNLNPEIAPKLRINPFYSAMIKRADNSKDNACMKDHLQEARWFIKSLHSRNDTLLRVARSIIEKQTAFLEHGSVAMRPMVLRDIAEELELHESTISRVTTQKYMHTPNGIFEFKHFFSSHVSTDGGGECSSTAIRAIIKELISNEDPAKPLSDSKIADFLNEKGIHVARRTIAKYREAMFIASSSQRKRIL
ncbi:RNA polymerase factor sigma-54 [Methylovulum psychrotolerans]|uniref:RNA polymerase sigma-54 factor n=1 Tax=Methylovulum psychrotolerans TaxID=1704499 RepID=A0A1Z4C0L8_9GAMM|nr:RNA polymerase factor sigma-54 [Methylovulum psychrotolerans]ASF47075.1 RNA polymerase factor sigma-54 [Methylovulum psychrotolerans]MBT9098636.1 RNA polymerase factor sigma-54 [Methylovulum psychrotolerans]POZ52765.1 RNA polymerase factor sigma-54 [Methylovulum psychrotolerans]